MSAQAQVLKSATTESFDSFSSQPQAEKISKSQRGQDWAVFIRKQTQWWLLVPNRMNFLGVRILAKTWQYSFFLLCERCYGQRLEICGRLNQATVVFFLQKINVGDVVR